jgi:hypothetical protein
MVMYRKTDITYGTLSVIKHLAVKTYLEVEVYLQHS